MEFINQYSGTFLNHLEGMYSPGDRDLAIELLNALGLSVREMRFTSASRPLLAGHFNPADSDPTNNIVFLYEMPELLRRVVDLLKKNVASDVELGEAMATYREASAKMPPIMPHFGVRYRTAKELAATVDRLECELSPALAKRVFLFEVPPYKPIDGLPDIRQVFVRTDVFTTGTAGFEQAIELQALRES